MDRDGTKAGYDLELTELISGSVNIPVIASGGAGEYAHFYEALTRGKADAVLAASLFHFNEIPIPALKDYLAGRGIPVRKSAEKRPVPYEMTPEEVGFFGICGEA